MWLCSGGLPQRRLACAFRKVVKDIRRELDAQAAGTAARSRARRAAAPSGRRETLKAGQIRKPGQFGRTLRSKTILATGRAMDKNRERAICRAKLSDVQRDVAQTDP